MGTIGDKPPHPTKKMVTSLYKKRFPYYSLHNFDMQDNYLFFDVD